VNPQYAAGLQRSRDAQIAGVHRVKADIYDEPITAGLRAASSPATNITGGAAQPAVFWMTSTRLDSVS
jgi:hypothetical protein